MKICARCGKPKRLSRFSRSPGRKDGRTRWCKNCTAERARGRYEDYERGVKTCSICKETKPLSQFYKRTANKLDGKQPQCKECTKAYADLDAVQQRGRERRRARTDEECKRLLVYWREWHSTDEHRKHAAEYNQKWRAENPEYQRKWHEKNPEKYRIYASARRTKIRDNGGSLTVHEWETLRQRYDNKCLCCGKKKSLTIDHIIPVSCGGTSDISNIQPLCQSCNSTKGTKTIDYR